MWITPAFAQAATGAGGTASEFAALLPMVLIFVVFYFLLIRPQQKKAKEHQSMLGRLAAGDEVVTAGGILGKVVEVGDNFTTIEIADGVRIKIQKYQITSLMPKGTLKGA
jgi:preprotein translocase subunit YajC